ncbi:MAG: response regulator [Candidatus Ratteibacteria bacterium]|jgi:CheY-like chemotaxis protein
MKKILIIDDEEDFCYFTKKSLEATGNFEVSVCNDSREAMNEVRKVRPDLVLLDILMPRKDGTAIATELKESKDTKDIPFVFLTALVSEQETEKHKNVIGEAHFVSKPVKLQELISIINKLT